MNKVIIEITVHGAKTVIDYEGNTYKTEMVRTAIGAEESGDDLESIDALPDDLYDALSRTFVYGVMEGLDV